MVFFISNHFFSRHQVELVCTVHAHPVAVVKWFKNSMALTNDTSSLEKHHHQHKLNIAHLSSGDFGNYTCRAENKWREDSKVIEISGQFKDYWKHSYKVVKLSFPFIKQVERCSCKVWVWLSEMHFISKCICSHLVVMGMRAICNRII